MPDHASPVRLEHCFVGICGLLLVAEVALHAAGYQRVLAQPSWSYDPANDPILRGGDGLHEAALRELWRPAPGSAIPWQAGERVNASGYRGRRLGSSRRAGTLRIAVLGEGNTFGEGVSWEETYCARVAHRLGIEGTTAEVLDAGVIGYSVQQSFERYLQLVSPSDADVVVLATTGIDESAPSLHIADRARIDVGLRRASGWSFVSREPVLDVRLLAWLRGRIPSLTDTAIDPDLIERVRQRQRLRASIDTSESGSADWTGPRRVSVTEFDACLVRFVRRVREDRAEPILVCLPRPPETDSAASVLARYDDTLRVVGRDHGAAVVDGGQFFSEQIAAGAEPGRLFAGGRLAPAGHALLAEELARAILACRRN